MVKKGRKDTPVITPTVQRKIRKILEILATQGISFEQIVLFGSNARGDARKDSDIDLCIIVDDLKVNPIEVQRTANFLAAKAGVAADFVVTSIKKYKTDMVSPLLHEVRCYGIPLSRYKKTRTLRN